MSIRVLTFIDRVPYFSYLSKTLFSYRMQICQLTSFLDTLSPIWSQSSLILKSKCPACLSNLFFTACLPSLGMREEIKPVPKPVLRLPRTFRSSQTNAECRNDTAASPWTEGIVRLKVDNGSLLSLLSQCFLFL